MTAEQIKAIREEYGVGFSDAKRALEIAAQRFDGDVKLGVRWVHANSFAINVKGDRAAWNDAWARDAA